jgi:hypothetical protein
MKMENILIMVVTFKENITWSIYEHVHDEEISTKASKATHIYVLCTGIKSRKLWVFSEQSSRHGHHT